MSFLVLYSLLASISTIYAADPLILPQGHGPYRSSLTISELVDHSRPDPYNSSHPRRLMISRFEPVPRDECHSTLTPYFPPIVATTEDEILAEYGYPTGIWSRLQLSVCKSSPKNHYNRKSKYPLALFSPGLNTTRLFYNSLAQEIASHGFSVVTIDHPYDVDVVQFPNGDVIYGGVVEAPRTPNASTASVEKALDVRATDASFILDEFKISKWEKVIFFGQSFGGAAAATAMKRDGRIVGGVNLDGFMFGEVIDKGLGNGGGYSDRKRSFLLWGSDGHNSTSDDSTWTKFWNAIEKEKNVWKREMSVKNSTHGSYWDLNILVDVAGIRDSLTGDAPYLIGPILGERVWKILGRYLPAFFRFALGLKREDGIFEHPSKEFPEVVILR